VADEKEKKKKSARERLLEFFMSGPTTKHISDANKGMQGAILTAEERKKRRKK
jgi:hypothetical protein